MTTGAAYGDALMAALGAGRFRDFNELGEVIRIGRVLVPDGARHEIYKPYCRIYNALYQNTKELMHLL